MKRLLILGCVVALALASAAPASAKTDDTTYIKEAYSIPDEAGLVEDPGSLNHGCAGGLYTFVDGTFKVKEQTSYSDEADWNAGTLGATKTVAGVNKYNGLWDVDSDDDARFELRDNDLRYDFTLVWVRDGSETVVAEQYASIRWKGSFIDTTNGETTDWWNMDFTVEDGVMTGTYEGTC